jgi:DeoR/GlpR family transcriptional regulator of sugar metabolism
MSIYNREQQYISLLSQGQHTVSQLSEKLFVSEPTVRRDIVKLEQKGLLECKRGIVKLVTNAADKRIPLFIRDTEQTEAKTSIAVKAAAHIKDGFVIMMDASTTAYHLIPILQASRIFYLSPTVQKPLWMPQAWVSEPSAQAER